MSKYFDELVWDLTSSNLEVCWNAAWALGELGDARAVEPLIGLLTNENKFMCKVAAWTLGKLGDVRAVESLANALRSESSDVRQAVVWALGNLETESSMGLLVGALQDRNPIVREEAARALGKLGGVQTARTLIEALEDHDNGVRRAVAEALNRLTQRIMTAIHKTEKSTKILMIEDDYDMCELMQRALKRLRLGWQISTATSGVAGLELALQTRPDLVLLDLMMPGPDGWAVGRQLQEIADIPIIIASARSKRAGIILPFKAADYIVKPFSVKELVARCDSVLAMSSKKDDEGMLPFLRSKIERLRRQRKELFHRIESLEKQNGQRERESIMPFRELGAVISGIVHDLRGGLGVIRNTAGFMLDDVDTDASLTNDLRKIAHSAEFCEVMIRNLMALGGEEAFEPAEVNIEEVVREVFFMLERKLVDVELAVDADPDTPTIVADEGQMKQVFMNLIKNAGEAMLDGGTLSVRTRREGEMLRIEVGDTGCGISPENQARLFREFFTTKAQGYGLGLHIVKTIVERHGGTIEVQSQLGEGTTFILHLPVE